MLWLKVAQRYDHDPVHLADANASSVGCCGMTYLALITGASSGIGEATARRLAREPDVQLILVARRAETLDALAAELGGAQRAQSLALDLTDDDAPARVKRGGRGAGRALASARQQRGRLVAGRFGEGGWANVERHMKVNFEAPVRLTEALLPLLRATAASGESIPGRRVAIVNVASTAGRVARPNSGAYSASKFAFAGWTDALHLEELEHRVHVGLVLPGFVQTEGFPSTELLAKGLTRGLVSEPDTVAEAIMEAGPGDRPSATPRATTGSPLPCGCSLRGSSAGPRPGARSRPPPRSATTPSGVVTRG